VGERKVNHGQSVATTVYIGLSKLKELDLVVGKEKRDSSCHAMLPISIVNEQENTVYSAAGMLCGLFSS
jgi:hypothetical protein